MKKNLYFEETIKFGCQVGSRNLELEDQTLIALYRGKNSTQSQPLDQSLPALTKNLKNLTRSPPFTIYHAILPLSSPPTTISHLQRSSHSKKKKRTVRPTNPSWPSI